MTRTAIGVATTIAPTALTAGSLSCVKGGGTPAPPDPYPPDPPTVKG